MDMKTAAVARNRQRDDSIWLVAGFTVKARNVYEALFVNTPFTLYRQCVVYAVLERHWLDSDNRDERELDDDFEFYCDLCQGLQEPKDVQSLLDEITLLVGDVTLSKTGCQCCGEVLDTEELSFSSCCEALLCLRCLVMEESEHCGACGTEKTPVEILALLADG